MNYWEIKDALHRLMVRNTAFHEQIMSDRPDWRDLWRIHMALRRLERYLQLKEDG